MTSLEDKLAKVEKELEDLKAEYQNFAYTVAHDLGAPMRAIEGFSAIIMKEHAEKFDEKTQKNFDRIVKGVGTAKAMLEALLEYSRLSTQENAFTDIDSNALFDHTKRQLEEKINQSKAKISVETLPQIQGDERQLSKVFQHLLHNALHYQSEDNTPEIQIACEDKGAVWIFSITDNGIGIKENSTEKIFNVLKRAVSNKHYQGMGMGLTIAQKVLKRHGGTIWVESSLGNGATFYFSISKDLKNEDLKNG